MWNYLRHHGFPLGRLFAAARICFAAACGLGVVPAVLAAPSFKVLYHESVKIETRAGGNGRKYMRLDAYGKRFELTLAPNEGIRAAVPPGRTDIEPLAGTVDGQTGSWVRITRTRAGWRGMLFDGHELYAIEPAADLADSLVQPLTASSPTAPVMYRLADALMSVEPGFCGTANADEAAAPGATQEKTTALKVFKAIAADLSAQSGSYPAERLMMGVVADYEFASLFDDPAGAIIARMDIVDGIFSTQVGVKISLAPVTLITTAQEPFTKTAAGDLLTQLKQFRASSPTQLALGVTHLMTGRDLDGDTVGIAYQGTVCNGATAASLSEGSLSTTMSALIAAHELGHNFNAPHDGVPGACANTPQTFLMAPRINGSNQFSSCSLQQMLARIKTAQCLTPYLPPDVSVSVPVAVVATTVGTPFTVSFSVNAAGDDASSDVAASATLPSGVSMQSATVAGGSCTTGAGTVTCSIGAMNPGEAREVDLQLTAGAAGTATLVLAVTSSNDSDSTNDSAQVTANTADSPPTATSTGPTNGGGGGGGRLDTGLLGFLALTLMIVAGQRNIRETNACTQSRFTAVRDRSHDKG